MQTFGCRLFHVGLALRVTGQGPRLVLIHGGLGSRTHWFKNVKALAAKFTVMTLDLPGFGESSKAPAGISNAEYLTWVAQAVRMAVQDQKFHLAGFSFGGAVSAGITELLASQNRAPAGLTLISPSGFGKPTGRTITLEKVPKSEEADPQEIRATTARNLGRWMLAKEPPIDDPAIDIHLSNVSLATFDSRAISYEDSLVNRLRRLNVPIQVLLGEQDHLIFPSLTERKALLSRSLPRAQIGTIPDAGHWLPYEASSVVNAKINHFHLQGEQSELSDH